MANLALRNINKIYDNGVQAVFDFSVDIKDGEFIVLVGPSGCGKSTTLRMIAGLENITSGDLVIDGVRVNDKAAKDRDIAMVFQNYALYAHMSVYHNMAFSLVLRKENAHSIHKKVLEAAEILELTSQLNKKPRQLSGGQRQRVALGRAIVRHPKVFLLDEPLSNLDAKLRGSMRRELALLHERLKATMIYVTHDQIEALTLADRIVIMDRGYIQQVGTPLEVYEDPDNTFVAAFIGTPAMNLLDAKIEKGKVIVGGVEVPLDKAIVDQLVAQGYDSRPFVLGVRPEHVRTADDGVLMKIALVEPLGANTLVHGLIGDAKIIVKLGTWFAKSEDCFRLSFTDKIYFFDAASGKRIRW